jgi:HD-like signal output (HDOD) protein
VASPPVVYHKLKDAIQEPKSTFQFFVDIIRADSGLSSRTLMIVKSSFYGLSISVDFVTEALNIIGVEQLRDLALATVVMRQFMAFPKIWTILLCSGSTK